jgi:hypothetical protein
MLNLSIRSKLKSLVRETIRSGDIVNIVISKDDNEDDAQLEIRVVYESKSKKIDPSEVAGITIKARKILLESNEENFPVFYFIHKSEAGSLIAAE